MNWPHWGVMWMQTNPGIMYGVVRVLLRQLALALHGRRRSLSGVPRFRVAPSQSRPGARNVQHFDQYGGHPSATSMSKHLALELYHAVVRGIS